MASSLVRRGGRVVLAGVSLGLLVASVTGGCSGRDPLPVGGTGGGSGTCAQTTCGTECVDLASNAAHCGACNNACPAGMGCLSGTCACGAPLQSCGGLCVDVTANASHCGACDQSCGAGQTCVASACSCSGGLGLCGGLCVDLASDETNCGACGIDCGVGASCEASACECQAGLTLCLSGCADLASDGDNCGTCGTACGALFCLEGACVSDCGALAACGSSCVDTQTSVFHCGGCDQPCPPGQACADGRCGCPAGQLDCDGACVDIQSNPNHCGACGTACPAGQSCADGSCGCPMGTTDCGSGCVNTQSDVNHCGECGNACTGGQTCEAGVCSTGGTTGSCADTTYSDPYTPGDGWVRDPQVTTLLAQMTLAEKADQMRGMPTGPTTSPNYGSIMSTPDVSARQVRGYIFRDGPRGVNLEAPQDNRNGGEDYSTAFPVPAAQGASFDLDLVYRLGVAMGDETMAAKATMLLAPNINILRHPAWGRSQEAFGEDSWHTGRMGAALTAGIQTHVAACAKHYAANNIENGRFSENAQMDDQTLHEIYGRHFEMVAKEGGVACVMAAMNLVNGKKSTESPELIGQTLKTDFGFRGFVMTDWWAMTGEQNAGLPTAERQNNARDGLNAGLDMELPWSLNYSQIESIVGSGAGQIPASVVDEGAGRVLDQKFRFGSANPSGPFGLGTTVTSLNAAGSITNNDTHLTLAREAARKSMVLLKNDGGALPIASTVGSVAVLGGTAQYSNISDCNYDPTSCPLKTVNFARDLRTGDRGSSRVKSNPAQSVTVLQGIQAAATASGKTVIDAATAAEAGAADLIVVAVGLTPGDEGEEYTGAGDRTTFALDGKRSDGTQNALVAAAVATGKPVVVVLFGGSVIEMPWRNDVAAVIMAWYPGQQGGAALGELLFGSANFSGKLPVTWGTWDQWPTFDEGTTTTMSFYVGYRYFDLMDQTPIYPFGHGLSYTTFDYTNLTVPCTTVSKGAVVDVEFNLTNAGSVAGDEVAFLFVSAQSATRQVSATATNKRSEKELRGFVRAANLAPGETRRVKIPLRVADLKYWNAAARAWEVEAGTVQILVGPSAGALPLEGAITVQ